jgi:3-hydroxyacyl-[acyl-carrier-protein] dehydratase
VRYILLDRVTALEPGRTATGIKCVTLTDEVVHDHFPSFPMLPGALVIEIAAHLGGFLLDVSFNPPGAEVRRAIIIQVNRASFHKPAQPGDRIELTATIAANRGDSFDIDCVANIDGELSFRGTLTFILRAVPSPQVNEQRRYLYQLWTAHMPQPPRIP